MEVSSRPDVSYLIDTASMNKGYQASWLFSAPAYCRGDEEIENDEGSSPISYDFSISMP